jgi:YggT family protein
MLIGPLLEIYTYIVVASMVLTWLPVNGITRSLTRLVDALTEPLLQPIRKALPQGGQNWAPAVLYFGLVVLRGWVES